MSKKHIQKKENITEIERSPIFLKDEKSNSNKAQNLHYFCLINFSFIGGTGNVFLLTANFIKLMKK